MKLALVAITAVAGCKAGEPRLTAPELAALEARSSELTAGLRHLDCERPVLRGPATPGDGTAAVRELLLGEHGDCYAAVGEPAADAEIRRRCAAAIDALVAAVRHESVCGPTVTLSVFDDRVSGVVLQVGRLAKAVAIEARHRRESGDPRQAAELVLDAIRLTQDVRRGGATLLEETAATSALRTLVSAAGPLLLDGELPASELAALGAELDRLIASAATAHETAAGEEPRMLAQALADARQSSGDLRTDHLAGAVGVAAYGALRAELCPAGSSHVQCARAWEAVDEVPVGPIANARMRARVTELVRDDSGRARYAWIAAESRAALVALAAAVKALGAGRCPPAAPSDPLLGGPLEVAATGDRVAIRTAWRGREPIELVDFRCPSTAAAIPAKKRP